MSHFLHIAHPSDQTIFGFAAVLATFVANNASGVLGNDWTVKPKVFDVRNSLNASAYVSEVLTAPGPVLIVRPVQTNTLVEITTRLEGRQLVVPADAYDLASLVEAARALKAQFDRGEPLIPLRRAVALMLVRKLHRSHMWGGNAKGYMWAESIPKGRGLDEAYHSHVADLVYLLSQHEILISKISNSKRKYALNPERRSEIGDFLRNRKFSEPLERVFARQGEMLTARVLDILDDGV